ncbi:primosomal protein N' [Natranaerobius thermophilus]|uniref:Replication restart protein PriA n=1 Tax=Natranaerobius thermophilus (strain ATCC BAA-1301 / DSM 18059 / JW/NM-WN-LF) TaxID=457570 RepID=B2A2K0_NATTJ|nr:primosomal protein N' [Natranaerobius thermophilus]ACB84915.1 primosomal protein N' [Natranaerobius thermophilus JW/NM-WN-LF]
MKYCHVTILDIVSDELDRQFTYKITPHLESRVTRGSLVKVPFGKRNVNAVVNEVTGTTSLSKDKIKNVNQVLSDQPLPEDIMELAQWMSSYYLCSLSKAYNIMVPQGLKSGVNRIYKKYVSIADITEARKLLDSAKAPKQRKVLERLLSNSPLALDQLLDELKITKSPVESLYGKGIINIQSSRSYREPIDFKQIEEYKPKEPTQAQKTVLKLIKNQGRGSCDNTSPKKPKPFLLFGVTGSGKTEIYLQLIESYLQQGLQTIVLIPEISLTPQTIERFVGRFGNQVAVTHSKLSHGERLDQWEKMLWGKANIVVGPRSAVFAPFSNLGLIIIDEEQEGSYKQEELPRYHAREVAERRCQFKDGQLLLGTATPSLESIHRVKSDDYNLAELPERVGDVELPDISVIDMKEEFQKGNKSVFSRELILKLKEVTDKGEQTILFLNRRGYSTFLLCRECGYTVTCPRCEVTLTYHKSINQLLCHYCDYTEPLSKFCPDCNSDKIKEFGTGTQKIERELKKYLPDLKTIRMDVDTTRKKNSHQELLGKFKNKQANVLIGTQMIAKGLDFPDVSLVGIITADTALNLPDFRAGEKTFQLLTQVAGRAGRRDNNQRGQVVIQTYNPDHYSIEAVKNENVRKFTGEELALRKKLGYPPFKRMIRIMLRSPYEQAVSHQVEELSQKLQDMGYEVLGPTPCPIPKIKDEFRWHLMLRLDLNNQEIIDEQLRDYLLTTKNNLSQQGKIRMAIDVDPLNLL